MGTGTKSPTRRQKGCAMCKFYKNSQMPMKTQKSWNELRKLGKKRRVTRHDLGE